MAIIIARIPFFISKTLCIRMLIIIDFLQQSSDFPAFENSMNRSRRCLQFHLFGMSSDAKHCDMLVVRPDDVIKTDKSLLQI